MSIMKNINSVSDNVKNISGDIPIIRIEDDSKMCVENYNFVRLFTNEQICIDFDNYMVSIEGSSLGIDEMGLYSVYVRGKINTISYLDKRKRE